MAKKAPIMDLNSINYAILHHSGSAKIAKDAKELKQVVVMYDKLHGSKSYALETKGEHGLKHISYHFAIAGDGSILQLQDIKYVRHHCSDNWRGTGPKGDSANYHGIAILLDGNFDNEKPTNQQVASAIKLIKILNNQLGKKLIVQGHKERSGPQFPTACPGEHMGVSTNPTSTLSSIARKANGTELTIGVIIAGIIALLLALFTEPKGEEKNEEKAEMDEKRIELDTEENLEGDNR